MFRIVVQRTMFAIFISIQGRAAITMFIYHVDEATNGDDEDDDDEDDASDYGGVYEEGRHAEDQGGDDAEVYDEEAEDGSEEDADCF